MRLETRILSEGDNHIPSGSVSDTLSHILLRGTQTCVLVFRRPMGRGLGMAGLRAPCLPYHQTFPIWLQICPHPSRSSPLPGLSLLYSHCWGQWLRTASPPSPAPAGSENYGNHPCPVGHYCPAGTSRPRPCPAGTFGGNSQAATAEECQPCPPSTFSALPGQAACLPCGSAAFSLPGEPQAHACLHWLYLPLSAHATRGSTRQDSHG